LTLVTTFWFRKFSLTSAGCGTVSLIGRDGPDIHGYRNREDPKMAIISREFGLALKVQLDKVRTDIESGDKADAKQGTAYQPSPQE
jgi:hypothetical protein